MGWTDIICFRKKRYLEDDIVYHGMVLCVAAILLESGTDT